MANKQITELTAVSSVVAADEFAVQKSGETTVKKANLTQVTAVEAAARAAQDDTIEASVGLTAAGAYDALTNAWYLRAADFTAGGTDRGGATGALTQSIKNALRLLDIELHDLASSISGTSEILATSVTASASEILACNTVPKVLIDVPTDYVAEVISISAWMQYNSATYAASTNPIVIRYATGETLFEFPNAFLEATSNAIYRGAYTTNQVLRSSQDVQMYCAANPTTGNSTITFWIMYRLHDVTVSS